LLMKQREGADSDDTAVPAGNRLLRKLESDIPNDKDQRLLLCCERRQERTIQLQEMDVGTLKRSCLKHYDTGWEVAGPIRDELVAVFNRPNPSSRTITLG
jgi:hypothetical protein